MFFFISFFFLSLFFLFMLSERFNYSEERQEHQKTSTKHQFMSSKNIKSSPVLKSITSLKRTFKETFLKFLKKRSEKLYFESYTLAYRWLRSELRNQLKSFFFTCQTIVQIFGYYIKFSKGRIKTSVAIEMFKTENQWKTPLVVSATNGMHVFKAPVSESWHDYHWSIQRYSINTQAVEGYNLQFIDIATGFPGSIHDSWVLRNSALNQRAKNNEMLLEPKVNVRGYRTSPTLLGNGVNLLEHSTEPSWTFPWMLKGQHSLQFSKRF